MRHCESVALLDGRGNPILTTNSLNMRLLRLRLAKTRWFWRLLRLPALPTGRQVSGRSSDKKNDGLLTMTAFYI
ncbi:hypothetical protein KAX35_02705 [candidate division WOR-3 bacterium]|nr:hypothetical protein [candidate division WOR-3 bacterium]